MPSKLELPPPPHTGSELTEQVVQERDGRTLERMDTDSPWAPLGVPIFRAFWIASLVSNLGTWVHEVGAGWLMTNLDSSPEMVSAVRIAISAPTMLLAIPAGVLADRIDRRRLLIVTQFVMLSTTTMLATLTFSGAMTSWTLLGLTFVMGLGTVLHVLTWQSTVPELVPKTQLSRAVALGSISFNLARAIGPAIGGLLIAMAGVWIAFAVNALSFAGVLVVLLSWRRENTESAHGLSYGDSMRQGFQFVLQQPTMRNVLIGVLLFLMPATAMWSLLPLVARQQLGWNAGGYGLLVTTIGLGAVFAARILHPLQHRLKLDRTVAVGMLAFALGLFVLSFATSGPIAMIATFVMGAAWMITLTTLNATAQMTLTNQLRARGMGCYMTVIALGMSSGALVWGQIAGTIGLAATQSIAAATLVVTAAIRLKFTIDGSSEPPATPACSLPHRDR